MPSAGASKSRYRAEAPAGRSQRALYAVCVALDEVGCWRVCTSLYIAGEDVVSDGVSGCENRTYDRAH